MRRAKARWLLGALLCLALWPTACSPAETSWERLIVDGLAAHQAGRYPEAEPLYKRSLAILLKALGPEHPNVATSLENYAVLLRKMDRDTEAEKMEARAQAIRAKHVQENP